MKALCNIVLLLAVVAGTAPAAHAQYQTPVTVNSSLQLSIACLNDTRRPAVPDKSE
jgi:hypothetical protein